MARSLKLDIITLHVSPERKPNEQLLFDEFFRYQQKDGSIISRPFADFFGHYVNSFNGEFSAVKNVSKAISLEDKSIRWNAAQRIVSGIVEGGNAGAHMDVKARSNARDVIFRIDHEHVTAEPFHFLLWMPHDYPKGFLLVQGYTNSSVSDAFKHHLAAFVRQECPGVTLHYGTYVDKENAERFRDNAVITQVVFRRTHIEPDVADDITGIPTKDRVVNVDVKISGLNRLDGFADKFNRWRAGEVPELIDIADLRRYGIDGEHETIVGYTTEEGRKASAKSRQEFELNPRILISPDEVAMDANGRPNDDQMRVFMRGELARIQDEIGYTTAKRAE